MSPNSFYENNRRPVDEASMNTTLQQDLAELAKFPEMNPGPVCRIQRDGQLLLANSKAQKLFPNDQLIGSNWVEVCPGLSPRLWQEITQCKDLFLQETEINNRYILFTYVCSEQNIFVYGTDITQNKLTEKKLEEQTRIVSEIARFPDMNPGPVLRMNLQAEILLMNAAATKVFGENLVNKVWTNICPNISENVWKKIVEAEEVIPVEAQINGKHYVFSHRSDKKTNLVFVFGADVTHQKQTEQQLRQSEKMATLGTLAAGVAHELNNPAAATGRAAKQLSEVFEQLQQVFVTLNTANLNSEEQQALNNFSDKIKINAGKHPFLSPIQRSDMENAMEEYLENQNIEEGWKIAPALVAAAISENDLTEVFRTIQSNENKNAAINWATNLHNVYSLLHEIGEGSGRISEIVGALKNYSFLDRASVLNVNIHEGLDNTLVILRSKLKEGITVERRYASNIPPIMAYGSELNQVWTNILDNAADAMKGKGEIMITTKFENENVTVELQDNGPGIPIEIQHRIFDPFFTTKEPGKGTGLGLSTTYGIVTEKHKGKINVKSQPGKTIFTITLPIQF